MNGTNDELLMDACNSVIHNPDLRPEIDPVSNKVIKTHCNEGALIVAQALGCHEFDTPPGAEPMMAQGMVELIVRNESGRWSLADGRQAAIWALSGGLCFAAMTAAELDEAHAHICAVFPAACQESGSLGRDVPMVANVGTCQEEEKSSQAFPISKGEALYYIWQ